MMPRHKSPLEHRLDIQIRRLNEINLSQILLPPNTKHVLFQSALIEYLFRLDILLKFCEFRGLRYSTKNDLPENLMDGKNEVGDVSALIAYARNAIAHPLDRSEVSSRLHEITEDGSILHGIMISVGNTYGQIQIVGQNTGGRYDDDVYVKFSRAGIYIRRHLMAAYDYAVRTIREMPQPA